MNLPLYADARDQPIQPQGHLGLYWERFFDGYPEEWHPEADKKAKEAWTNNKTEWLEQFDRKSCGDSHACEAACVRQRALAQALHGECRTYKVEWRFVTGTGLPHPMENGFLWHPTLGVPYLSGNAVKGLVRSWIEAWNPFNEPNDPYRERLYRWFGSENKDPVIRKILRANRFNPPTNAAQPGLDTEIGDFIFFDALPTKSVRLKADVMTPHMGKWYEKGGEEPNKPENQPADWHSPNPIGFLTAEKPTFQFAVAPRNERAINELERLMKGLDEALTWLGVGAKTAVGYGHMSQETGSVVSKTKRVWSSIYLGFDKGRQELNVIRSDKGNGFIKGELAKEMRAKLPSAEQKLLDKKRLYGDVEVEHIGGGNWSIIRIVKTIGK